MQNDCAHAAVRKAHTSKRLSLEKLKKTALEDLCSCSIRLTYLKHYNMLVWSKHSLSHRAIDCQFDEGVLCHSSWQ